MTEVNRGNSLLPSFSVRKPVSVVMILSAILVIGYIAYTKVKLDLFPSGMNPPFMGIWVPLPDANPKEVEEQIVKPVEGQLKTVKGVKRLTSNSGSNGTWFWLEFNQETNMDLAYSQVSDRMERARPLLPDEIEHYFIRRFRENDEPVIYMAVTFADQVDDRFFLMERFIKHPLERIKGVANIEVFGLREKYIQVILDPDKARQYQVNLSRLMQDLFRDNFSLSGGHVFFGERKFLVRVSSRFSSLQEVADIIIRPGLKLGDIAAVVYDYDEEETSVMRVNNQRAAGLVVYKESEANTVEVCEAISATLDRQFSEQEELAGSRPFVFWNQGEIISESIGNIQTSGMWGGIFAFLVLFMFLRRFRITLMLALAIPLSLLFTVIAIYFLGWTLNSFTMMGLMLSIGLVVDNAIVITENIYRLNSLGEKSVNAAISGASQVGLAITMSTLTSIVVFLPMMIMSGNSFLSFYLTRIGTPVIVALLSSLFIALVFIPQASLRTMSGAVSIRHATHSLLTQNYQNWLVKVLKNRFNSLLIIILLIMSVMIPLKNIKMTDMAEGGPRDARIIAEFPPDYSLEKADQVLQAIGERLWQKKDFYHIQYLSSRVSRFRGNMEIYLEPERDRQWHQVILRRITNLFSSTPYKRLSRSELSEELKKDLPVVPGVRLRTTWRDESGAGDGAVSYSLRGYDTETLRDIARELEKQIRLVPGVISVENSHETGNDEIHITLDREKSFLWQMPPSYVSQYIALNLRKRKISDYHSPEKEIPIYLLSPQQERDSVGKLRNLYIRSESGGTTLSSLADLSFHKSIGNIRRENGKALLELKIYIGGEDLAGMRRQLNDLLARFQFPTGYSHELGQASMRFDDQNADLQAALLFSIVFVFLIMGVLFESFILPLTVLVTIPAAFTGSYWLLMLTGTPFDIMAGIGLVVLIGVVVNHAIVYIDLINQYRAGGMTREQAIIVAGVNRLRPILMTALTTICGLIPMAVGNASLVGIPYSPMGVTMIGGLLSSTFLTLFAVPVFYTYFDELRSFWAEFRRRFRT